MIYSIVNYDVFYDNVFHHKTVVLPELKLMEIKVAVLGTHIVVRINNVQSGRNDDMEPSRKN